MVVYGDRSIYIWDIDDTNKVIALYLNSKSIMSFPQLSVSVIALSFLRQLTLMKT